MYLLVYEFFFLAKLQYYLLALLEVGGRDDLPLVLVDAVELYQSVARNH